ncbi:hypothetical protein AAG570_010322 [Ranatra chinensis]|uniref:Uncharacterized protein n=1 Tax=Ranatra chinensis TaxID=642074 RepID=A0ABD0Z0C5_9HEMI
MFYQSKKQETTEIELRAEDWMRPLGEVEMDETSEEGVKNSGRTPGPFSIEAIMGRPHPRPPAAAAAAAAAAATYLPLIYSASWLVPPPPLDWHHLLQARLPPPQPPPHPPPLHLNTASNLSDDSGSRSPLTPHDLTTKSPLALLYLQSNYRKVDNDLIDVFEEDPDLRHSLAGEFMGAVLTVHVPGPPSLRPPW